MKILYKQHSGGIGTWRIWAEGAMIHIAHATTIGGSEVWHKELVEVNKSGRTLEQQVQLRIDSRISRMRDRGYKDSIGEAQRSTSNQMGFDRPMLAQKHHEVKNVNYTDAVLQKKLDGHRCLITRVDGELIAYTRQGKPIHTIKHILSDLAPRLPEGVTLDGELYVHGVLLQTIGSWIKREQPNTALLKYVTYDMMSNDPFQDRWREMRSIVEGATSVIALPFVPYVDSAHMSKYFRKVRDQGFEGLMLRTNDRGYEAGKRSRSLLKIKEWLDEEFKVIGFEASKTGWAICKCITRDGKPFDCSAPGSHAEKQYVMDHQDEFLNRYLTIEFAHWTDDGKPFQPNALRWREDV